MSDLNLLANGEYYIRNDETFAGRNHIEDRSGNPKKVTCPTDFPDDPDSWIIERLPSGRYTFKARGAPTGVKGGLLFAFLVDTDKAEEWKITLQALSQRYTIEKADRTGGWVKQGGENPQIAVRPLIVGPSDPPFFPPNQLWNFEPAD